VRTSDTLSPSEGKCESSTYIRRWQPHQRKGQEECDNGTPLCTARGHLWEGSEAPCYEVKRSAETDRGWSLGRASAVPCPLLLEEPHTTLHKLFFIKIVQSTFILKGKLFRRGWKGTSQNLPLINTKCIVSTWYSPSNVNGTVTLKSYVTSENCGSHSMHYWPPYP
jgi:hypothetical protein